MTARAVMVLGCTSDAGPTRCCLPRSIDQAVAAMTCGARLLQGLPGNAVLLGEMGIANTASAALLLARLHGVSLQTVTGRGTGLDDAGLAHKQAVLARALARSPEAQSFLAQRRAAAAAKAAGGGG